MMNDEA